MLRYLLLAALSAPGWAWAHGHSDASPEMQLAHYARIAELAPLVTDIDQPGQPYVRIAGERVYLNGPFWELVQGWVRIYYNEIQEECDRCLPLAEDEFLRAAEDQAARSFFNVKVASPAMEGLEHISVGTADLASRLGKTAGVAKVTAEVAETVVSKMVGGGGIHLICHVLDAVILFGTRHFQTAVRAYSWAGSMDRTGLGSLVRMGFVSSIVWRAQRKVNFVAGPVELDEEELKELDEEGPNRWWGWVKQGKRAKWLRKVAKNGDKPVQLARGDYLGSPMIRYAFLKGRRRGHAHFMRGNTEMDQAMNRNVVWVMAVQENLFRRAFVSDDQPAEKAQSLAEKYTPAEDDIRQGLAAEYAAGNEAQVQLFDQLLRDVDVVFQPGVPRQTRYFHAAKLEALITGFMYHRFNAALNERSEMHGASLMGILRQIKLHWRAGRFGNYMLEWVDFLKLAATEGDPRRLRAHKYEAMESLLRTLKAYQAAGAVVQAETREQLAAFENLMAGEYDRLRTFTPWREKRSAFSWNPFRRPVPACVDMNQRSP